MTKKYEICYPDYDDCIINITATVLNYFNLPINHKVNDVLLEKLKNGGCKKVVLIVLDGMGSMNLFENLEADSFILNRMIAEISSVFPPTTVAALNAIETESMPNEHCWLGWNRYYRDTKTMESGFKSTVTGKLFPLDFIDKRFRAGKIKMLRVSPFPRNPLFFRRTLHGIIGGISLASRFTRSKFIYSYFGEPDATMHAEGTTGDKVKEKFAEIEKEIIRLNNKLKKNTAVIIIADHGQVDINNRIDFSAFPDFMNCLSAPPYTEPSAISFCVKDDKKEEFKELFEKYISGYILMTKEEVLAKKMFGTAENTPQFIELLGDYLAIAIGKELAYNTDLTKFKGMHAGLRRGEMKVPLIFFTT